MSFRLWLMKRLGGSHPTNPFKYDSSVHDWKLNLKPSPKDDRDYLVTAAPWKEELPESASLQAYETPIKNQMDLGACSGFAVTGAVELLRKKFSGETTDLSELFSYYNGRREIPGAINKDTGAYLRDVIHSAYEDGLALEENWPYEPAKFSEKPSFGAYFGARFLRVKRYWRCYTMNDFKKSIANGYPVVFGMTITQSFIEQPGTLYIAAKGAAIGGHAMLATGYDKYGIIVRNSWGSNWANSGRTKIAFDVLEHDLLEGWSVEVR